MLIHTPETLHTLAGINFADIEISHAIDSDIMRHHELPSITAHTPKTGQLFAIAAAQYTCDTIGIVNGEQETLRFIA